MFPRNDIRTLIANIKNDTIQFYADVGSEAVDRINWCTLNLEAHDWFYECRTEVHFYFYRKEDAMAYKLRWE